MSSYTIHASAPAAADSRHAITGREQAKVLTSSGLRLLSSLTPCTKATLTISGGTVDGDVTLTARHGSTSGNAIRVEFVAGGSLGVSVSEADVSVQLGSATAQAVVDAIAAHAEASELVVAAIGGDGSGVPSAQAYTALAGGLDDGEYFLAGDEYVCVATLDTGA